MTDNPFRCATWNVHRAKGSDGKRDPERVMRVVADRFAGLDLLSLQEADEECPPHARIFDVARIVEETGLVYQHDDARMRWGPESDGFLGTIVFLHPRFEVTHRNVLDLPGHCHRGVVILEIQADHGPLRVVAGHLSLSQMLRVVQMRIVGQYIFRRPKMPTLLLGDFNEWRPWGGAMFSKRVVGRRFAGPVRATFPATRPMLPLDRVMVDDLAARVEVEVIRGGEVARASDHLPLRGRVTFV